MRTLTPDQIAQIRQCRQHIEKYRQHWLAQRPMALGQFEQINKHLLCFQELLTACPQLAEQAQKMQKQLAELRKSIQQAQRSLKSPARYAVKDMASLQLPVADWEQMEKESVGDSSVEP